MSKVFNVVDEGLLPTYGFQRDGECWKRPVAWKDNALVVIGGRLKWSGALSSGSVALMCHMFRDGVLSISDKERKERRRQMLLTQEEMDLIIERRKNGR